MFYKFIFQDQRKDRTLSQNFDFTVKRNSEGKLNIAVLETNKLNKTINNSKEPSNHKLRKFSNHHF